MSKGFTFLELLVLMLMTSILAAVIIAMFSDSSDDAYDRTLESVAASLTTASSTNYRIYRSGSPNYIRVTDCTDIADKNNVLRYGQFKPDDYIITPSGTPITPGDESSCIITAPNGHTESFITIGTS